MRKDLHSRDDINRIKLSSIQESDDTSIRWRNIKKVRKKTDYSDHKQNRQHKH